MNMKMGDCFYELHPATTMYPDKTYHHHHSLPKHALKQEDIVAPKGKKLISPQVLKGYSVKKGPNYASKRRKPATDLTQENMQRVDRKEMQFKEYNFTAKGLPVKGGYLHTLLKARITRCLILFSTITTTTTTTISSKVDTDDFPSNGI